MGRRGYSPSPPKILLGVATVVVVIIGGFDQIIEQRRKRPGNKVFSVTPQVYHGSGSSGHLRRKGRELLGAFTYSSFMKDVKLPIRIYLNYDAVGHSHDRDCRNVGDIVKLGEPPAGSDLGRFLCNPLNDPPIFGDCWYNCTSDDLTAEDKRRRLQKLFDFAQNNPGVYSDSIPAARHFYPSSGYQDELLWAAAWLYRATNNKIYADFIANATYIGGTRSMFSWDDKFVDVQVLIAREVLSGGLLAKNLDFERYIDSAEEFICNCVGIGNNNVAKTKGGLLWFTGFGNLQYVNSASFVISAYADYIAAAKLNLVCSGGTLAPPQLIKFAQSQMDYIHGWIWIELPKEGSPQSCIDCVY